MSAKKNDLDVIAPEGAIVVIADVKCRVRRIRVRELMLAARVLTAGIGESIKDMDLSDEDWQSSLQAAFVMAIPEAHEEFLELLRVLVEPIEPIADDAQEKAFRAEMENPDLSPAIDVVAAVATQEHDTFEQLLGKAKQVFAMLQALYRKGKTTKKTTG